MTSKESKGELYSVLPPELRPTGSVGKADEYIMGFIRSYVPSTDCPNLEIDLKKARYPIATRRDPRKRFPKRNKKKRGLTRKEKNKLGLLKLPKTGWNYTQLQSMRNMWTEYMRELFDWNKKAPEVGTSEFANFVTLINKAEYIGADIKIDHQKPADDGEDLEDGEIEDDDDNDMPPADVPQFDADGPTLPPVVAATAVTEAVTHKSSEKSSKDARKERKSSRHEKKHMTEAEKSVLYLHKMERLEREKRDKYRREQVHSRRRGGSISPTPPDIHASTNNNQEHNANSDDAADEDFATSLQRVLQSVLKKDKSAQAQAAVAAVNQQGAVSTSTTGNTAATPTIADSACAELGAGGTGSTPGDEGDGSAETTKRVARRRKRERKKAVKRARLEAVLTAALSSDGPQLEVNDSNESTNINGGSPSHANNRKMDTQDDIMNASDYSISSDDEHDRHDRKNRERRCNRRMKRRYRSVDRDSGMGGTPTKVKKGETKLGLCLSYIQGKCMNRDCPYSHEYSPHMKMELCKFYLMECCAKGDKCYYLHSEFPCKYYHTGLPCIDGDKCKFNHGKPLSDSFRSILCKHIETAPKEILGDFPRFNREDAMNMIAITQKKLEEKYSEKKEMKDNDKNDDKRDAKRNRPSRWQDKTHDQMGSVVNLNFLHDKDQDMRFTSNNGDIDMRTLPSTPNNQPPHNIPLPITINTSTPPPNINLNQNIHHQPQLSPPMPHKNLSLNPPTITSNNNTANASASGQNNPSAALLQQLGVSNPAAAALLLAGAQSGPARVAAVAALLQGAVRSQQVQMLAGAPIVAGNANVGALNQPPPITMQIPPPQLNTNAILFSTPPPSILSTPPPVIRPPHLNQPPNHQQNVASVINPTRNTSTTSMMDQHHHHPIVTNPPPTSTIVADLKMDVVMDNIQELVQKNSSKQMRENIVKKDIIDIKLEVGGVSDDGVLDIERYKREAGIGRKDVKQESVQQVKREIEEEEDESGSLKIDYDPPLEAVKNEQDVEVQPLKPELPNLPRAQMDLFLRIQSQQAKSDKTPAATNTNEQSTITTAAIISDTSSNMDISTSSQNTTTKDNTGTTSNDIDPTSSIDWYSDDDDDDDDDDNKLTIGEDAEYDDIITKSVNEVPKSSEDSKKVQEEVVVLLPPVVEDVPPAAQIVEKLGDLSKIDISAEVTKLLTSIGSGGKKKDEKSSPSSTNKPSSSYTPPSDPRTGSKSPRSSTDPRLTSDHSHHHHHHRHHHHRSNDRAPSTSPKTASSSPSHNSASSSSGRADPRRRRSSAESSDSGKSSGSGRAPVPSIYDQATASFRMSNKDLDLRLGGSVTVVDSDLRTKLADVDLRSVSQGGRPDIDLRATMPQQLSLPLQFKAAIAGYTPATEIDATYHASYVWRIYEVDVPRPDYSGLRLTEAEARSTGDPRLEKIFRLAVGSSAGDLNIDEIKEKTEFTIDESPASPVRDSPAAAKPTTPRADPRRRKPIEEPPTNNDPTQLTYAQQLSLLQTSNFYQNLTSNQKLNLNHELSIRMQQQQQQHQQQQLPPNAHPQQHHHQQQLQQPNTNTNDPVMGAVLHSLGLTGGNSLQQQQHQQQQMMVQLQQYGAIGLMQQLGVGGGQRMGGGGPGGGGGPPSGQQGLLGAAPGVPHDFGGPIQPPFVGGPPNLPPIRNNNNPGGNFNNSPNDNYDQYEDDESYNNCYNSNNHNSNMMMGGGGGGGGGSRNNHRGGNNSGGGGFRDNRNNRRGGGGGTQGQNRNFGRNNRNNFRSRNRNNNMGNNQNRGGMVD